MNVNYIQDPKTKIIAQQTFDDTYKKFEILPPNFYKTSSLSGPFQPLIIGYEKQSNQDDLINFSSGIIKETIDNIDNFLSEETKEKYKKLKVGHKLGVLLHGPPGTGKTSTVSLLCNHLIKEKNAICIDFTPDPLTWIKTVIKSIRKYQDNPIVVFVDEFESDIRDNEPGYLTFLDGSDSFNNIIFIACTNYLEKIPDRIKYRKSRIKHLIEIKAFPLEVYKEFIINKVPDMEDKLVIELAYKAEENCLTLDNLKHVIIDFVIENISFDKSIEEIKSMSKIK